MKKINGLLLFISILSAFNSPAQMTTRAMKWNDKYSFIDYVYSGQIKNNIPNGIGLAISKKLGNKIFGYFKNGVLDGLSVTVRDMDGIYLQTYDKGTVSGPAIEVDIINSLYYGNMEKLYIFEDKIYMIDKDDAMYMGEMHTEELDGRVISSPAAGNILADNMYEFGKKEGPGYEVKITGEKGERISGIWEDDVRIKKTADAYPSFMQHLKYKVIDDDLFLFSNLDQNGLLNDTCYTYNKSTGKRLLGNFENGSLKNGLLIDEEGTRSIGSFGKKGNEGISVEYKAGSHLSFGNFKNDLLDGEGIKIDFTDGDTTIQLGNFSHNFLSGNAGKLTAENIIVAGNFEMGEPTPAAVKIIPFGYFAGEGIKEPVVVNGTKINSQPKDVCTAINFLLKELDNDFVNITGKTRFNPYNFTEADPFASENFTTDYRSLYYFPGALLNKVYSTYKGHAFYFGMAISDNYAEVKKKYDLLCQQLAACTITSWQKGKTCKLTGNAKKLKPNEPAITTFYIPPTKEKNTTPEIVITLEKAIHWQLIARIYTHMD